MKSRVTERGQITIPKPIRQRLGIRAGEEVTFDEAEGGAVTISRMAGSDPLDELYGVLDLGVDTDEFVRGIRGEPDAI